MSFSKFNRLFRRRKKMNSFWLIIFSIGIAQGIFLVFSILLQNRAKKLPLRLLLCLLLAYLFLLTPGWLASVFGNESIIFAHRLGETLPLLVGPLFWLHSKSLADEKFQVETKVLVHFLPFLASLVLFAPFYLQSNESKLEYLRWRQEIGIPLSIALFSWFKAAHTLLYLFLSRNAVNAAIEESGNGHKRFFALRVLRLVIYLHIMLSATVYLIFTFQFFDSEFWFDADKFAGLLIVFSFYVYAFILVRAPATIAPTSKIVESVPKYQTSSLKDEHKEEMYLQIRRVLDREKAYLDSTLTLDSLARLVGAKPNQISQVINESTGKNFHALINEYRVNEVTKNIDDSSRTLYAIALDAGFNSKSAFNRIFKEITGMTPTQYRKSKK